MGAAAAAAGAGAGVGSSPPIRSSRGAAAGAGAEVALGGAAVRERRGWTDRPAAAGGGAVEVGVGRDDVSAGAF